MVTIEIKGFTPLLRKLGSPKLVRGTLKEFVDEVSREAQLIIEDNARLYSGALRHGITMERKRPFESRLRSTAKHAQAVEYGSRTGYRPPLENLQPWARDHGFGEGLKGAAKLAAVIYRRGTKPHPYFWPSKPEIEQMIETRKWEFNRKIEEAWQDA